ncbi:MAG TPA: ABC transporter substrate-binding protein [Thermoleophilaceae bacterium]|jgi:branched-chain amino acid transport system substrate-binding protein
MRKTPATYPALATLLVLLALVAAGCGSDDPPERPADGALAIYTSVPRSGVLARDGAAIAAGQRLALRDAGGRAGERRVRLVELDSAGTDDDEPWDPGAIESNAERAVDDPAAVAYLGEAGLGGSAVSVPVTNSGGLLQVSPGDTLPSLTQPAPGGSGEGPARYYPEGGRTFLRLVPHGGLQAAVLVDWARSRGARKIAIVRDEGPLGQEMTTWLLEAARRARIQAEAERVRPGEDDYADLARDVAEERPGAVVLAMAAGEDPGRLVPALRAALPSAPILSTSGVAANPPAGVDYLDSHLPREEYPRGARRVLDGAREATGAASLYGYESMRLVLDAIARARPRGTDGRAAVVRAALAPRRTAGVIGPYSIVRGGDVATSVFGAYRATPAAPRPLGVRSAETATAPRP